MHIFAYQKCQYWVILERIVKKKAGEKLTLGRGEIVP
jgi:hypothetical protein